MFLMLGDENDLCGVCELLHQDSSHLDGILWGAAAWFMIINDCHFSIAEGCTLKLVLAMRGGPINTRRGIISIQGYFLF